MSSNNGLIDLEPKVAQNLSGLKALASAPGKVILFGEHAVVYGRPAIAAPVSQLRATAICEKSAETMLIAPDLGIKRPLSQSSTNDPLTATIHHFQRAANLPDLPPFSLTVSSQIPIASGLGSGAAISAAIVRAMAVFCGVANLATDSWVCDLTYEIEKLHHGTPSGIDNTVVAYEKPVYFMKATPQNLVETFTVKRPLRILIADSGVTSKTIDVVSDVRQQWLGQTAVFNQLFDNCAAITIAARTAIATGDLAEIGRLMNENHRLLQKMTVSAPILDTLIAAAMDAGAMGAKLSGAGRGGNVIALVDEGMETAVSQALLANGAKSVLSSWVKAN